MRLIIASALCAIMILLAICLWGEQENLVDPKNALPLLGNEGPFASVGDQPGSKENLNPVPVAFTGIAGGFAVLIVRDPSFAKFSQGLLGNDHYLDARLEGNEWGALFLNVLKCPDTGDITEVVDESNEDWQARYSSKFQQAIPTYPMLGRIYDTFIYVGYKPEEIGQLRDECLRVQSTTSNEKAVAMLKKLVKGCDEASKVGAGLLLTPD